MVFVVEIFRISVMDSFFILIFLSRVCIRFMNSDLRVLWLYTSAVLTNSIFRRLKFSVTILWEVAQNIDDSS